MFTKKQYQNLANTKKDDLIANFVIPVPNHLKIA